MNGLYGCSIIYPGMIVSMQIEGGTIRADGLDSRLVFQNQIHEAQARIACWYCGEAHNPKQKSCPGCGGRRTK